MKTFLLSLLLCAALCPIIALAQQPADSTRAKWEVGLDLLWLIDKNQLPATSVFFRKHTTTKTGKLRAYRFRVGAETNKFNAGTYHEFNLEPYTRIGYEFKRELAKKYMLIYGLDGHIGYSYKKSDTEVQDSNLVLHEVHEKWKTLSIGIVPFIGFRYQISKSFCISAESTLPIIYKSFKYDGRRKPISQDFYNSFMGGGNKSIDMGFQPLSVLNFIFTIK